MKTFKINEELSIECEYKKTRNGFKHTAELYRNGRYCGEVKYCYLNRTWEKYEYQSVIHKLLEKSKLLSKEERELFRDKIAREFREEDAKETAKTFGVIGMIAQLGEVFHAGDQKATNDWKARMIRAGLWDRGLIMPEDWDTLPEDVKKARLDLVIKELI